MNWLKKLSPKKWKWFKPKKVETKKIMVDGEEFRPLAFLMDDIFPVWKRDNFDFKQAQQVMRKRGFNDDAIDDIWGIYLGQRKVVKDIA
ncbi:unnamed protein product [Phytophthora lilii]|uniref:Unnamed protein product n=1 Tax=Phytophthora lilii TaxID=2077276 RepID=A0A9W6XHG5_9STRA|nr:unnamed protein product [Phytophthora lilii]